MKNNFKFLSISTFALQFLIVLLTSFISKASAEDCQYTVSKDNGNQYDISNMSDFVKNEIRPEIKELERLFNINIIKTCDNSVTQKVVIGMNSKTYYVLFINGNKITEKPSDIVKYDSRLGLDLDKKTFTEIVDTTYQYDFSIPIPDKETRTYKQLEELYKKQRIIKMYAFVFAETARFEDAYNALDKIFKFQCSIDWSDFDALVHNWSNISRFVIKNNLLENSQFTNGKLDAPLVAPITTQQTQKFIKALEENQDVKYSKDAPFINYDYERCKLVNVSSG